MTTEDQAYQLILNLALTGTHVNNPYHNQTHCNQVFAWCEEIAREEEYTMTPSLMWSALFHDYNHSGGTENDDYNIDAACAGVRDKMYEFCGSILTMTLPEAFEFGYVLGLVDSNIRCTKFLGHWPIAPANMEQRILRDADLMTIFLPTDDALKATNGLYEELNAVKPMTREEFWEKNEVFLRGVGWHTDYARRLALVEIDYRLAQVKPLFLSA